MSRLTRCPLAAAALLAVTVSGCSGGSAKEPESARTTMTQTAPPSGGDASVGTGDRQLAELKKAVSQYSVAYLSGDADTAFALLSDRCALDLGHQGMAALVGAASQLYDTASPNTIDAKISGPHATVSYSFDESTLDQTNEPWLLENGHWHNDQC
ncbi:MAG: hypothetical protein WAK18_02150 [Nocardioidaceae bacterium]